MLRRMDDIDPSVEREPFDAAWRMDKGLGPGLVRVTKEDLHGGEVVLSVVFEGRTAVERYDLGPNLGDIELTRLMSPHRPGEGPGGLAYRERLRVLAEARRETGCDWGLFVRGAWSTATG